MAKDFSYVFYHIPQDGDSERSPNAFLIRKPRRQVTVADIRQNFPLPGTYYFRFKQALAKGFVWVDVPDESDPAPAVGTEIRCKVTRLSLSSRGDGRRPDAEAAAASSAAAPREAPRASPASTASGRATPTGADSQHGTPREASAPAATPTASAPAAPVARQTTPAGATPKAAAAATGGASPVPKTRDRRTSTEMLFSVFDSPGGSSGAADSHLPVHTMGGGTPSSGVGGISGMTAPSSSPPAPATTAGVDPFAATAGATGATAAHATAPGGGMMGGPMARGPMGGNARPWGPTGSATAARPSPGGSGGNLLSGDMNFFGK